jgi:hypothetical protein
MFLGKYLSKSHEKKFNRCRENGGISMKKCQIELFLAVLSKMSLLRTKKQDFQVKSKNPL